MDQSSPLTTYTIFIANILIWGLAWPISKVGLYYMPPIWYGSFRLLIGGILVILWVGLTGKLKHPKAKDLPLILSIGLLQMSVFLMLINSGLSFIGAGRSAILVYSTPLWVTPIVTLVFGERLTLLKMAGLLLGLLGILMLFSPWQFDWRNTHIVIGNGILIASALTWAIVMIHTRYAQWHATPLDLLPWQLIVGFIPTTICALYLEPHSHITWNATLIITLLYNGALATAFGYWASVTVSKNLPVITTSLGYLGVPAVGFLSSAFFLNEPMSWNTTSALLLIVGGLACISMSSRKI